MNTIKIRNICPHSGFHRTAADDASCLRTRYEAEEDMCIRLSRRAAVAAEILRGLTRTEEDREILAALDALIEEARS